jgi:hypothetical protein
VKAKVGRGKTFDGLFKYLLGVGVGAKELKQPQVLFGTVSGEKYEELLPQFERAHKLRPEIEKPVWHCSLSLVPGERFINDSDESPFEETKWEEICREFMTLMGFSENTPYVVIRHRDKKYDHVHIVASRIDYTGKIWKGYREVPNAINATQKLEKKFGLQITPGYDESKPKKNLSFNERKMQERLGEQASRDFLQKVIDDVVSLKPTVTDFCLYLEAEGVELRANLQSTGRLNGFSFAIDGIAFKGSNLGKDYSWEALQKRGVTYEPERDLSALKAFAAGTEKTKEIIIATKHTETNDDLLNSPQDIMSASNLTPKVRLQNIIDRLVVDKPTAVTFCESLRTIGVIVYPNLASTGKLSGLSFEIDGITFKGSSLGKDYSWGSLQKRGVTYEPERDFDAMKSFTAPCHPLSQTESNNVELLTPLKMIAQDQTVAPKDRLQRILNIAANTKPSVVIFCETLEAVGIKALPNLASTGRLSGFSFEIDGVSFKGSSLGKGFSWQALQCKGVSYDTERDGPALRDKIKACALERTVAGFEQTTSELPRIGGSAPKSVEGITQGSSHGTNQIFGQVGGAKQVKQAFNEGDGGFRNERESKLRASRGDSKFPEQNFAESRNNSPTSPETDDSLVGQIDNGHAEDDALSDNSSCWSEAIRIAVKQEIFQREEEAARIKKELEEKAAASLIMQRRKMEEQQRVTEDEELEEKILYKKQNRPKLILFAESNVRPEPKEIQGYYYIVSNDNVFYYKSGMEDPSFIDFGKKVVIFDTSDEVNYETSKLAQEKWGSFDVSGPMSYKIQSALIAARYGFNLRASDKRIHNIFEAEKKRLFEQSLQSLQTDQSAQDKFFKELIICAVSKFHTPYRSMNDSLRMAASDKGFAIETDNDTIIVRSNDLSKVLFSREISDIERLFSLTNSVSLPNVLLKNEKKVNESERESSTTSPRPRPT